MAGSSVDPIERLFRDWAALTQKPIDVSTAPSHFQAQNDILDNLFNTLSARSNLSADLSVGLVKGIVASEYGTLQPNRETWEQDSAVARLAARVRDLLVVIGLQALCIGRIVRRAGLDMEEDEDDDEGTLPQSREDISAVNMVLLDHTIPLVDPTLPVYLPTAVFSLACSILLNSVPPHYRPPTPGINLPIQHEFARRAFEPRGEIFAWIEAILSGPLFDSPDEQTEKALQAEYRQRKLIKDLTMGLVDMIQLDNIPDQDGLRRIWTLAFSVGSPRVSAELCEDFWVQDDRVNTRRAILAKDEFPRRMTLLPLLATLTGRGSQEPFSQAGFNTGPSLAVFKYFSALPSITLLTSVVGPFEHVDGQDTRRRRIRISRDLRLPGGGRIQAGTLGDLDEETDAAKRRVSLQVSWNAWPVLFELLGAVSGVPGAGAKAVGGDGIAITVADLSVEADRQEVLAAGLGLLKAILHPTFKLDQALFATLSFGSRLPVVALTELAIRNLHRLRDSDSTGLDGEIILSSLEILSHLTHHTQSEAWTILRNSNFFTASNSLNATAAGLLRKDSERDTHAVTFAIVRLVQRMCAQVSDVSPADLLLVRLGLQLITSSVFVSAIGWRFADPIDRFELFARMLASYLSVLRNPYTPGGAIFTDPASFLIKALITSTSSHVYRPVVEVISPGAMSAGDSNNGYVQLALDNSLDLLTTLLRIASDLDIPANSLPMGLFSSTISAPQPDGRVEKLGITDHLFLLAVNPGISVPTRLRALSLIRCYVLSTSSGTNRTSLASVVRDIHDTTSALGKALDSEESAGIKTLIWSLLGTIVSTQPICASACTGPSEAVGGILDKAVKQVVDAVATIEDQPRLLASLLAYLLAVINSPTSTLLIPLLRAHATFWPAVFELSRSIVPAPPSFMLSMHADDFAARIEKYAYGVQAKANATLLLAAELNALAEEEDEHTKSKARDLVLGLFKSGDDLAEVIGTAGHNGCYPSEHEKYRGTLRKLGVDVTAQKSLALHAERAYGLTYLYDGQPTLRDDAIGQSSVNLALDVLNLSWSIVDAEIAYTNAVGRLSSAVLVWTEDDQLVTRPAIRSAVNLAEVIGEEPREGDIILAIQAERMEILAALVDMALGDYVEVEKGRIVDLWRCVRRILETGVVSDSLRHPSLPPLHKPMLRMLPLILGATARTGVSQVDVESPIAAATDFALDASDIVLNALIHQPDVTPEVAVDLSSIVGVLGEVVRIADPRSWVDKIAQHGVVTRSLEVVTRATLTNGHVPPQVASVILLHLSLASQEAFAERLALSGILPAYANNVIAVEGSSGSISSDMNNNNANSVHSIWCGMLMVVNALLSTLAPRPASNFAQSEVFPFIGAYHQQIFRALAWDKDASLTTPTLNQLDLVTTLFLGLAQALGPTETLMYEIGAPLLSLLSAITYELNHPNDLSRRFVASTEEERAELELELEKLDAQSPVLFDFVKTPILAQRVGRVMAIARNVVVTLVILTNGWSTLSSVWHGNVSGEHVDGTALEGWDDHESSVDEPISILTDLYAQSKAALTHIPLSSADASAIAHRSTINQLAESSMVLVVAQIVYRYSLLPPDTVGEDDKMDVDTADKKPSIAADGSTGGSGGSNEKARASARLSLGSGVASERSGEDESRKRLVEAAAEAVRQLPEYEEGDRFLVKLREVLEAIPGVYVAE